MLAFNPCYTWVALVFGQILRDAETYYDTQWSSITSAVSFCSRPYKLIGAPFEASIIWYMHIHVGVD
jgi:hypothetical protein